MENVRRPCQGQKIDERRGGTGGGEEGRGEGYGDKKMLTSQGNCLEATGHNVEAHGIWHLLLLIDCGIGQIEKKRHKSRIMYCSTFFDNLRALYFD